MVAIVSVSAKLQNGDSTTLAPSGSDQVLISVGMGRASNSGRTILTHTIAGNSYTSGYFQENSPGSTNTYTYGDYILSVPSGSSAESLTWSGAMVSSGDGDSVLYTCSGAHQSTAPTGTSLAFTNTTTPTALTISPSTGDLILYWIAFNAGGINTAPSGYTLDITGEMGNLAQGRWYSKVSDGTETSVTSTVTGNRTGTHNALVFPTSGAAPSVSIPVIMNHLRNQRIS